MKANKKARQASGWFPRGATPNGRLAFKRGSALITAVVAASVVVILAAGVLQYLTTNIRLNSRSHQWHQAMQLAEAAVETGLAEMNFQYADGGTFQGKNAFKVADGWVSVGADTYRKTVSAFVDNANKTVGSFAVTVSGVTGSNPKIRGVGTCTAMFSKVPVARAVELVLARKSARHYAIVSKTTIKLSGGGVVDSFDSSDPNRSTNGRYDVNKRQASAQIATVSFAAKAVEAGNSHIYGVIATGFGGTVVGGSSFGPTLVVAERATSVAAAEAKGWITHEFTAEFPDVAVPGDLITAPNVGTQKNGYTFGTGNYRANELTSSDSSKPIIIDGAVRIYLQGDFTVSGSGYLRLKPGATLELYVDGKFTVSGGGIVNDTNRAANAFFYGTQTSTTWTYSGSSQFIGVMYAPQAAITVSGSAGASGAFTGKSFTISGGAGIHFDEALGGLGQTGYQAVCWQEVPP